MAETPQRVGRQDILEGPYLNNPVVRAAVTLWMRGDCTWEEAMMYAVIQLSIQNEDLEVRLIDKISKEPAPNWLRVAEAIGEGRS